jgi:phosphatidate cytidylyltransferase
LLRHRLIFGTLIAASVIGLALLDGWLSTRAFPQWRVLGADLGPWLFNGALLTGLFLAFTLLATRELTGFAAAQGHRPLRFESYLFGAGLVIGPFVSFNLKQTAAWHDESWGMLWLAIALGYTFCAQAVRRGVKGVFVNLAMTLFIIFYAGGMAGYYTKLRMEVGGFAGPLLVLFSIFVVKITDTGAFFIGSLVGRTKLIPWISPKKTWEGLFGGIAVAVLGSVLVGRLLSGLEIEPLRSGPLSGWLGLAVFGLVMAVFSVAGDLCASLLKRDAAIKDSGNVIPGMGGMLDVIDSPLLAAPAAWFCWTRIATLN